MRLACLRLGSWELSEMVKFTVNGTARTFDGDEDMPLLWYLRDDLRLTGTRFGCGAGLCGACTVHWTAPPSARARRRCARCRTSAS